MQSLLIQAKKAQKEIRSVEELAKSLETALREAKIKRMDAFNDVAVSINNELADLVGAPLSYYRWTSTQSGYEVRESNWYDFKLSLYDKEYHHENKVYHGISEDRTTGFMRKTMSIIDGDFNFTINEQNGVFSFDLFRNAYHLLEVQKGLDLKPGFSWKEKLNAPVNNKFSDAKSLVKAIREFTMKIINIERLEEMENQLELKTTLSQYLKTEISKIELFKGQNDFSGVRFTVAGMGDFRVLKRNECEKYFISLIAHNLTKFFDLELAGKYSDISLQDWSDLKSNVSAECFKTVCAKSLGDRYTEAYAKKHGFASILLPFESIFVVDCSKV